MPGLTGDEAAATAMSSGAAAGVGPREDLLRQTVGAGEPHQAFDAAQRGFLGGALGDGHTVPGDPGEDLVEGVVVVELPAEGGDVLGGSTLQQESAFVVVEAESHRRRRGVSSRCMPMASRPNRRQSANFSVSMTT